MVQVVASERRWVLPQAAQAGSAATLEAGQNIKNIPERFIARISVVAVLAREEVPVDTPLVRFETATLELMRSM